MLRCSICSRIYQNGTQQFCTNDGGKLRVTETSAQLFKRVSLKKTLSFTPDLSTTKLQPLNDNIIEAFEALPTTPLEQPKEWQKEQEGTGLTANASIENEVRQNENNFCEQSFVKKLASSHALYRGERCGNAQPNRSLIAASLFGALLIMIGVAFVGAYFLREQKLLENNSILAAKFNKFRQKISGHNQNLSANFVKLYNQKKIRPVVGADSNFVSFSILYPSWWLNNPDKILFADSENLLDLTNVNVNNFPIEQISINSFESHETVANNDIIFPTLAEKLSVDYAGKVTDYKRVFEGFTVINGQSAYEFRFEGKTIDQDKKPIQMWGRTILLPAEKQNARSGLVITILATPLVADLSDVKDVGEKSELLQILKTIQFEN